MRFFTRDQGLSVDFPEIARDPAAPSQRIHDSAQRRRRAHAYPYRLSGKRTGRVRVRVECVSHRGSTQGVLRSTLRQSVHVKRVEGTPTLVY